MASIRDFVIDALKRVYERSPFIYGSSDKMIHTNNSSTNATGDYSLAEGFNTLALNTSEHAQGQYNVSITNSTIHTVGIGTADNARKNAHTITTDGKHYIPGIGTYAGTETTLPTGQDVASIVNSKLTTPQITIAEVLEVLNDSEEDSE